MRRIGCGPNGSCKRSRKAETDGAECARLVRRRDREAPGSNSGQALDECRRHGLVVQSERQLAGRTGSRHWHLRMPGRRGTLELSEWQGKIWVKVHPLREG